MEGEQRQVADAPCLTELALARLVQFTQVLRRNAFTIGLKESEDAARVLASDAARRTITLRAALKSLLCARHSDWDKFDGLFDAFWLERGTRRVVRMSPHRRAQGAAASSPSTTPAGPPTPSTGIGELIAGNDPGALERRAAELGRMEGASRAEHLAEMDFRKIADPQAMAETHALAARLASKMRWRLTRRQHARVKGAHLDL